MHLSSPPYQQIDARRHHCVSFIHALKWSFLAELASKAITPVAFIVLARLLTPEDFGVMSAAMMVIAFSQIFWEAGMGKALIQRQTDVEDAADVAFWINLGLGGLISALLLWGARPIALTFFQDERVIAVLQVMTLQVLLGALSSVQTALLQKRMGFKELFRVRLMTVGLPGLASIPLAWKGMGYWALVAGTLAGQAIQVTMLWKTSNWRPKLSFPIAVFKPMGKFGLWVGVTGLLNWFYSWADSLIIGGNLGLINLGLYKTGHQLSDFFFAMLFAPLVPVLYSHLSLQRNNKEQLGNELAKFIRIVMWISLPFAVFISVFSTHVVHIFLGEKWHGVALVISVLAIRQGLAWITALNGEAYRAIGKPAFETIVLTLSLFVYLPVYWATSRVSLTAFVYGRLILVVLSMLAHLYLAKIIFNIDFLKICGFILSLLAISFGILTALKLWAIRLNSDFLFQFFAPTFIFILLWIVSFVTIERHGLVLNIRNLYIK